MTGRGEGIWLVMSPEWLDYSHDPDDPPEPTADAVEVVACSAREAIRRAVSRPEMRRWTTMQRGDGKSPFAGLKAEFITSEVPE